MKALNFIARGAVLFVLIYAVLTLADSFSASYIEPTSDKPDYELQANCIAEYDYTHPDRSMMDNLVIALEECR